MFFKAIPSRLKKPLRTVLPHVGLALCSIIYVCFGAFIFHNIERPYEINCRKEIFSHYESIKQRLINRTYSKNEENDNPSHHVDLYIEEMLTLWENPQAETLFASYLKLQETDDYQWTPMSSFLFAATTVIPVGYGFITPATKLGRLLIIAYGLLGAPLALVTVTDIGEFMSPYLLSLFDKIPGVSGIYCLALLGFYILVCALLFHIISAISLLDSIYFSITTVFTIGYGDTPPPIPIPTLILFIIFGVILVTITVEIVAGEVINQIHYMGRKVGNAGKLAHKMLQMTNFVHMARGRSRLVKRENINSLSRLALLMSLDNQSILLNRPKRISLVNGAYEPKNIHIEFVDATIASSSETSVKTLDLESLSSTKTQDQFSISSAFCS